MHPATRRHFLRTGLAAAGAGWLASRTWPVLGGEALPFGEYPNALKAWQLPVAKRAKNVLEVFVHGGLGPWETFSATDDPAYGKADGKMWWTFQQSSDSVPGWAEKNPAIVNPGLTPFAKDALGHLVKFGPFADPLRSRADIVARLRLHVLTHTIFPHPQARALAATGMSAGSPRICGVGAAVAHWQLLQSGAPNFTTGAPAFVLSEGPNMLPFASMVGQHPTAAKPIELRVDGNPSALFTTVASLSSPKQSVVAALRASYNQRVTWPGQSGHLRSGALSTLDAVDLQLAGLATLTKLVTPLDFESPEGTALLGDYAHDLTTTKFKLAAKILLQPGGSAKHVTVVETGVVPIGKGFGAETYDYHTEYVSKAGDNYPMLWQKLCAIINAPGEADPTKLNLDDTLVVINTDFGRAPEVQNVGGGRNHYPTAYVSLMFGGPVGADQKGIVGAIDKNADPVVALNPAETRAATLIALGIYPFGKETFSYTDVAGAKNDADALTKLTQAVLGVKL